MVGITKYTDESWMKTNADRIRSMTDEELADWLAKMETKCYQRLVPGIICKTENIKDDWIDWLKQEAEDKT